uniref:Uncharacterized protein n=1 Tax=Cacopsylla melanoneura TaxID=428564 RepID=A0A8D8M289_9HEMI
MPVQHVASIVFYLVLSLSMCPGVQSHFLYVFSHIIFYVMSFFFMGKYYNLVPYLCTIPMHKQYENRTILNNKIKKKVRNHYHRRKISTMKNNGNLDLSNRTDGTPRVLDLRQRIFLGTTLSFFPPQT